MQPRGLHDGHHRRILSQDHECISPAISPLNLTAAPAVTYEHLFCLPSTDRLLPPARWKARGLLSGSSTLGTRSVVVAQNSRYDQFPPAANSWGIIHHIPDIAPQLLVEEEGPPMENN
jgi:hypothetical protein